MSVSGRRIARVMADYIRARSPLEISPAELYAVMKAKGYVSGSWETCRKSIYRNLKKLRQEVSRESD